MRMGKAEAKETVITKVNGALMMTEDLGEDPERAVAVAKSEDLNLDRNPDPDPDPDHAPVHVLEVLPPDLKQPKQRDVAEVEVKVKVKAEAVAGAKAAAMTTRLGKATMITRLEKADPDRVLKVRLLRRKPKRLGRVEVGVEALPVVKVEAEMKAEAIKRQRNLDLPLDRVLGRVQGVLQLIVKLAEALEGVEAPEFLLMTGTKAGRPVGVIAVVEAVTLVTEPIRISNAAKCNLHTLKALA